MVTRALRSRNPGACLVETVMLVCTPGRVKGDPAFRDGKVKRLKAWLTEHGIEWSELQETWFYSDSLNDLPLLNMVSHPVAVDPDETLKEHALASDWRVISLR